MFDGEEFYLTLPSNGAISMQEYPSNQNNSWKTRLNRPIQLDGEWEVGLANVSYPTESRLKDWLRGLKDSDILLKTGRFLPSSSGNSQKTFEVTYGDIKNYNLIDLKDIFLTLFKEEYMKVLACMSKSSKFAGTKFNDGGVEVTGTFGQSITTSTEDSFTLDRSTLGSYNRSKYAMNTVWVHFPLSFLKKFDFIKEEPGFVYKPTENLKIEFAKNERGWNNNHRGTSYGLGCIDVGIVYISFPFDINVTFLNLKDLSHTKGSQDRSLFIYCSLCDPQTVGKDTQQLLAHVNYKPSLKGGNTYEPQSVTYRGLRLQELNRVEIKIKEEDEENLAKFASGASTVTLHLRRI